MARVTVEDCLEHVENRFMLVLVASKRAHQLAQTAADPMVARENDKNTVIALREIAKGLVTNDVLAGNQVQSEEPSTAAADQQANFQVGQGGDTAMPHATALPVTTQEPAITRLFDEPTTTTPTVEKSSKPELRVHLEVPVNKQGGASSMSTSIKPEFKITFDVPAKPSAKLSAKPEEGASGQDDDAAIATDDKKD